MSQICERLAQCCFKDVCRVSTKQQAQGAPEDLLKGEGAPESWISFPALQSSAPHFQRAETSLLSASHHQQPHGAVPASPADQSLRLAKEAMPGAHDVWQLEWLYPSPTHVHGQVPYLRLGYSQGLAVLRYILSSVKHCSIAAEVQGGQQMMLCAQELKSWCSLWLGARACPPSHKAHKAHRLIKREMNLH